MTRKQQRDIDAVVGIFMEVSGVWPSVAQIAERLGDDKKTVGIRLAALQRLGYLRRKPYRLETGQTSFVYAPSEDVVLELGLRPKPPDERMDERFDEINKRLDRVFALQLKPMTVEEATALRDLLNKADIILQHQRRTFGDDNPAVRQWAMLFKDYLKKEAL